ncbi:MAG TPA: DUF3823 domain-containing protein [Mucilaginibacter sp.]|jgi:hypothetical protein
MKTIKSILLIACAALIFAGCKKDNYAPQDAAIHGALTDAQIGGPLQLSEDGNNSNVRLLVNDKAKYPAPTPQDLTVFQDGTYNNSLIFAESYKVFPLAGSGPWQYIAGDSTRVTIGSGQNPAVNFKVAPYFYISTPTVVDSTVTFTITKSTITTITNNLTGSNNLLILINNFNKVDESICSNGPGTVYENKFQFTVTNSVLGAPLTPTAGTDASTNKPYSFKFSLMHLPHGTYYLRVAILGAGSSGKFNYSPIVKITL